MTSPRARARILPKSLAKYGENAVLDGLIHTSPIGEVWASYFAKRPPYFANWRTVKFVSLTTYRPYFANRSVCMGSPA